MRPSLCLVLLTFALSASACNIFNATCDESDRECLSNPLHAKGLNGSCSRDAECKEGLYCDDDVCSARSDTTTCKGDPEDCAKCRITAECGDLDYCGSQRVCQLAGTGGKGSACDTTGDCKRGLVCETPSFASLRSVNFTTLAEITGTCKEAGTKEQGETCEVVSECLAGLHCIELEAGSGEKRCVSLPPSPTELPTLPPLWSGIECPDVESDDPQESYFAVPREGERQEPSDFYALPFPSDIRRAGNRIDMTGHPVAPSSYGLPFVERYIEVAGQDLDGFSTNPVVFFRFSHPYEFNTVHGEDNGLPATVVIVDITPGSPEYDDDAGIEWKTTQGDLGNYICPHWLGLRRPTGSPLLPGTTYAAIVTTGVKPSSGSAFARADDLDAMLAASAPADSDLSTAYSAFKPLRDWIADTNQSQNSILNATVFTTQTADAQISKLRDQIHSTGAPTIEALTVCDSENTASPCAGEMDRGKCNQANDDFVEVHAKINLPIFQEGTLPYTEPEDGGGFAFSSSGAPIRQGTEAVCIAISVPTTAPPAGGYPVLVYAHGTGGSFNGEMDASGMALSLARNAAAPAVLVGIDLPEHGSRRGDSTEEPEGLFYNFLNPRAARDNVLQGSADLMSVVYWVKDGGGLPATGSLSAVQFNPARIALMGHSQGATHSALIASYEPDLIGVVLSGVGGHLSTSLLTKKSPVDIASVVPFGLLDPDSSFKLAGGRFNPAMAIVQSVFDSADPINYARSLLRDPTAQVPNGHHAFMTYGIGDTYSPEETQTAYAIAGRLTPVAPLMNDLPLTAVGAPLSENVSIGGGPNKTIGLRQYSPSSGVDGHFVGVRNGEDGRVDVEHFLKQLLSGTPPEIGAP